jgi:UPF0755 protein
VFAAGIVLAVSLIMSVALPVNSRTAAATIDIPSGISARRIGLILKEAGVIRSPFLFSLVARARFLSRRLHAGEYRFSTRQSLLSVVDQLIDGEVLLHQVTIPEGLRMEEAFARVEQAGLGSAPVLAALAADPAVCRELGVPAPTLEGYLAPESYNFPRNFGEKRILQALVDRFKAGLPPGFEDRARALGLTPHQAVIVASLIEEEAYDAGERTRISAVFQNRLKRGMRLESCASVSYALGRHKARLYEKDLQTPSPYNTYLHRGLPPGPICSPGRPSLAAALEPSGSGELFFVSRRDGTHVFSRTFEEHLKAKARAEARGNGT